MGSSELWQFAAFLRRKGRNGFVLFLLIKEGPGGRRHGKGKASNLATRWRKSSTEEIAARPKRSRESYTGV